MGPAPDLCDQGRTVELAVTDAGFHPPIVGSPLPPPRSLRWRSEEDTAAFAQALAACDEIRDAFIELRGELGAGKTPFVRHLLRALGVQGRVKSPTYAVVEPHEAPPAEAGSPPLSIWHFDFYRFNDPREGEDAGFRDLFAHPGLKLAEWPDKAAGLLPTPDLVLTLDTLNDDSRQVTASAGSPRGARLMEAG